MGDAAISKGTYSSSGVYSSSIISKATKICSFLNYTNAYKKGFCWLKRNA